MLKKLREIEESVLKIYQKNNPSIHFVLESNKKFKKRKLDLEKLIFGNLKFPKKMFQNINLIDFGAGTGDTTIAYNSWGANCTLVDMNSNALKRAKKIFKKLSKKNSKNKFIKSSIFENKLKNKKYDIVTSIGVIHHTANPKLALKKISNFVKREGYLIFGAATDDGFFQRNLQRIIINKFAKFKEHKKIEQIALKLFSENIYRANKFGGRSIKAIIHDTYINPKIKGISFDDILYVLGKKFSYFSSAPDVNFIKNYDSPLSYNTDYFMKLKNLTSLSKIFMMSNSENYIKKYVKLNSKLKKFSNLNLKLVNSASDFNYKKKVNFTKLKKNILEYKKNFLKISTMEEVFYEHKTFLNELEILIKNFNKYDLDQMRKYIINCKILFKKSGGLGNNYYIFRRN